MNTRNMKRSPPKNKDASIKSEDDLVKKILAKLEKKDEYIRDLKLKIFSLREQVKGGNNSHIGPTHNVAHKVKFDLPRFDGVNN